MIEELTTEAYSDFSQENREVGAVKGLGSDGVKGVEEFENGITGLLKRQLLTSTSC